ncbi:hypothetical protein PI124_g20917 [Phytophthora idaei]|nr:hypothetical protein PI125_g22236 [Phytophthora idaei]KAG3130329.1 hypothetical protein PI126_g20561 [Phytophthora idaei]KAG3234026.1 hypothetical protein PI124_g20917 [Phytophthora idaei]
MNVLAFIAAGAVILVSVSTVQGHGNLFTSPPPAWRHGRTLASDVTGNTDNGQAH